MRVTITLNAPAIAPDLFPAPLVFEEGVVEAGPKGTFFYVVTELAEETTKSGLVKSVSGARHHTWVPASAIARVDVTE